MPTNQLFRSLHHRYHRKILKRKIWCYQRKSFTSFLSWPPRNCWWTMVTPCRPIVYQTVFLTDLCSCRFGLKIFLLVAVFRTQPHSALKSFHILMFLTPCYECLIIYFDISGTVFIRSTATKSKIKSSPVLQWEMFSDKCLRFC